MVTKLSSRSPSATGGPLSASSILEKHSGCSSISVSMPSSIPYTPPPMLNPLRNGSGLFASQCVPNTPFTPASEDQLDPAINVGLQFQAEIPSTVDETSGAESVKDRSVRLWSPSTCKMFSDSECEY